MEPGPTPTSDPVDLDSRWYRAMFEAGTVPMALADEDGLLVVANAAYCAMVGRSWPEIAGRSSRDFTHDDDLAQHRAMDRLMADAAERGEVLRVEKRYLHPDGAVRWGWVSASPVVGPGGRRWTMAVIHDTTDRRRTEDDLLTAASTDQLTGLLNRRGWMTHLAEFERVAAHGGGGDLVLAIIDLDRFKDYNDTRGHDAGDRLLAEFARAMVASACEPAVLARWGGEEFALALPGSAAVHIDGVLRGLARRVPDGQTFCAGYATVRARESATDCFTRADERLYEAKRQGRGRVLGD
ncbi:GGDEF domain-containing protein [Williamsia herbipolensis]|uniref:GGDEF domain-containing protein n=1 Tax=Williamsia herbipolensis TaxID=1603258 RepID=UPI0009E43BF6|nr:diguanylate cyclase [Williamsia herbipolensis]